jgi:protein LTV1
VVKGKSRGDLENILAQSDIDEDLPNNIGEATLYGIYYDDTQYDYLQHLRQVGVHEEGVESVLLEAPSTARKATGKRRDRDAKPFQGLVEDNPSELPLTYEFQEAVPSSIAGLQPDMDPHLRQVLEALEDDAFVDDELQDDFFEQLVADGERDEDVQFEFHEDPDPTREVEGHETTDAGGASWEARFQQFKNDQKAWPASDSGSDLGCNSEGGDTVSGLPKIHVVGGKRRRKGSSNASGYSMSSSSLSRTEALQTLDEQFDQASFLKFLAWHSLTYTYIRLSLKSMVQAMRSTGNLCRMIRIPPLSS